MNTVGPCQQASLPQPAVPKGSVLQGLGAAVRKVRSAGPHRGVPLDPLGIGKIGKGVPSYHGVWEKRFGFLWDLRIATYQIALPCHSSGGTICGQASRQPSGVAE